ncbi:Hint domain-containing protein [Melittangium boletus]|uniref:Hint domain-containing protein n=1 Tax=Melittangium boletus TaxID=83453 RepID=UPI001FE6C725|nr:Hint domain-containing protein [Melittangium boletus]
MHQTAVPMTLAQFQSLGAMSDQAGRCVGGISYNECKEELDWGLSQNLITAETYYWGLNNGYYPVIDRHNTIGAVCKCGCFEANSLILTQNKQGVSAWVPAKQITSETSLFSLNEEATLSRPSFNAKSIKVSTKGEEKPALFVFELSNGHSLKVTQNHGMLLSDGRVVEARSLSAGAEFVALDGSLVRVNNLRFEYTTEDVHNFEVDAQDLAGHIIAAEGVLVGDLAWQNQLSRELGSIAVRR